MVQGRRTGLSLVGAGLLAWVAAVPAGAIGTVVSGTVESGGTPIAGAFVALTGPAGQYGVITDAAGAYTVTVPPGTYTVAAQAQGYAVAQATGVDANSAVTQDLSLTSSGTKFEALGVFGGQIAGVVADGKTGVFYASTSVIPQVYRTADYGGSWAPVTLAADDATHGLDGSNVAGGLTASGFPGELAVVVSGTAYYSTDFGVTWKAVGGSPGGGMPALFWGHAGTTSVLLAVSGTSVARAVMTAGSPAFTAMTTPFLGAATDVMAVADGADDPFVAVVDVAGTLTIYALDAASDPLSVVGTPLASVLANPTFVRFGGAKASGEPPSSVLVYSSMTNTAVMATKSTAATSFVSGDLSAATDVSACGAGPGAVGSLSPANGGSTGTGTVSQCFLTKNGTSAMTVANVPGINNNTGLAYDADHGGAGGSVMISGDGNRGLVKSAAAGTPMFPSDSEATAGTGPGSGGVSVHGFNVAVVKDVAFGPAGATQFATVLSGSGGALSVASDDGGVTMKTAVRKGGRAVAWWQGASVTWLLFGYGGAGDLLAAHADWTAASAALPMPNVTGSDGSQVGTSANAEVTALAGVPGTDAFFLGSGDDVDQQGTTGRVVRAEVVAGTPPSLAGVTEIAAGALHATVRALAYCPSAGSDASIADVLLIATATGNGGSPAGELVRVSDASGASPSAAAVASIPAGPLNDVRAHCGSGTVWVGAGSNGGGPSGALYKSTDGGATFAAVSLGSGPGVPPNLNVQVVAVSPADGNEALIAGNSEGFILHTTDGGTTWDVVNDPHAPGGRNFLSEGVGDLEIPPPSSPAVAGAAAPLLGAGTALVGTGGGLYAADVLSGAGGGGGDACATDAQCDDGDGDECTLEVCAASQCVAAPVTVEVVYCELDALAKGGVCGTDKLDKKLKNLLKRRARAAKKQIVRALKQKKTARKAKLLGKARRTLKALVRKAGKGKSAAACKDKVKARVTSAAEMLDQLD
jgi:Carboxypeptidase regulatory-like domain/BNR/Asp-box repeat